MIKKLILTLLCGIVFAELNLNQELKLNELKIKDWRGDSLEYKDLVVFEWVNFSCPYVRKHYSSGNMQSLQTKYRDLVTWVSVLSSAPGKEGYLSANEVQDKLEKEKWQGTYFVLDPSGELGKKFGAKTTPHIFIFYKNSLVYKGAIDSIPSTKEKDLKAAENYVDQVISNLLSNHNQDLRDRFEPFETKPYGCSVKY